MRARLRHLTLDLRVLDASFYLPAQKRDANAEYAAGHNQGAIRFDQDKIADHSTNLPHTIPSPDYFAAEVGKLGISENDRIVVYDGIGMFASPRVWWLFRVMGAKNVFVLDGGLDGWKAEGRPLETGETLSDREFQVLRMIGSGKPVGQIAEELGLSVKTVSTYRARVLEKMGMQNNAELTHYAIKHQLVD